MVELQDLADRPAVASTGWRVAVIGATGAVGAEMIKVLHDRTFPLTDLRLFASERSAGRTLETPFGALPLEAFAVDAVAGMDIALLAVSGAFAQEVAPKLAAAGVTVIDNSSAFRYDPAIPLIVPEINGDLAERGGIIANPNCTTAILVMALAPIARAFGLERVIVSTYQAASGAGAEGMTELETGTRAYLAGHAVPNKVFRYPLAFNLIPQIDSFEANGYSREEMKVVWETRKILGLPDLPVSCTAVRIPTFRVHAESVTLETSRPATPDAVREVLATMPGLDVVDDPAAGRYPMPMTATGRYNVEAGRIRRNPIFGDKGIDLFLCGDQLLKGAALNAVQIAERLAEREAS
jgi:aspartate-semialdehyde dehydrogenase